MYGLLTKCEVKMAGYWPSAFFACLWTETKSRSINSQKRMRPISNHLDRTNLVNKGFIIWLSGKFFMRDTAGGPERARWLARVANHSARFGSSCPLTELASGLCSSSVTAAFASTITTLKYSLHVWPLTSYVS